MRGFNKLYYICVPNKTPVRRQLPPGAGVRERKREKEFSSVSKTYLCLSMSLSEMHNGAVNNQNQLNTGTSYTLNSLSVI